MRLAAHMWQESLVMIRPLPHSQPGPHMSSDKSIPKSRLGRIARLASAGARTGASMFLNRSEQSTAKSAQKTAAALGDMRALGAKVGQMLAFVDGILPESQQAIFAEHLKPLLESTPTSPFPAIKAQLEAELGASIEDLYDDFDPVPLASASLGQVHRATLKGSGEPVAVKVQHPGIEEALHQDLKNVKLLESMAAMAGARKFDSATMIQELRTRFLEELDYEFEAKNQQEFIDFHAHNDHIVIPGIYASHSSRRVLTSDFMTGISYEEACAHPDDALRAAWCDALWRFYYEATIVGSMFNADPHPGNYRFLPDGKVIFFDFGCVQRQPSERSVFGCKLHLAAARRDDDAFREGCVDLMGLQGGEWQELAIDYMRLCFEPWFGSPYRITSPYVREVVQYLNDLKFDVMKLKDDSFTPLGEGMLFVNRLQFGFYSVLSGLNVEVDYAAIELSYLEPLEARLISQGVIK